MLHPTQPIFIDDSTELSLPTTITFDINFQDKKDGIHLWFSQTKKWYWDPSCDGLIATFSSDSSKKSFTYRFHGYRRNETLVTYKAAFTAEPNKTYRFKSVITDSFAHYYIDGKLYASTSFPPGTVPSKGYFGFATYQENFRSFVSNEKIMSSKARLIHDHAEFGRILVGNHNLFDDFCGFVKVSRSVTDVAATNAKGVYDTAIKKAREAEKELMDLGNASDGISIGSGVLGIFAALAMIIPGGQVLAVPLLAATVATGVASAGTGIAESYKQDEFEKKMSDITKVKDKELASNEVMLAAKSMGCLIAIAEGYEALDVFYPLETCIDIFCTYYVHQLERSLGDEPTTKEALKAFYKSLIKVTHQNGLPNSLLEKVCQSEALSLQSVAVKLQSNIDIDAIAKGIKSESWAEVTEDVVSDVRTFGVDPVKTWATVAIFYYKSALVALDVPLITFNRGEKLVLQVAQAVAKKLGRSATTIGKALDKGVMTVAQSVELVPVHRGAFKAAKAGEAAAAIKSGRKYLKWGKICSNISAVFDAISIGFSINSLVERAKKDKDFKAQLDKAHDHFHEIIGSMKSFNETHIPPSSLLGPGYLHYSEDNFEGEYGYTLRWSEENKCFAFARTIIQTSNDVEEYRNFVDRESVYLNIQLLPIVQEDLFMIVNRNGILHIMRCSDHKCVHRNSVLNTFIAGEMSQAHGCQYSITNIQKGSFSLLCHFWHNWGYDRRKIFFLGKDSGPGLDEYKQMADNDAGSLTWWLETTGWFNRIPGLVDHQIRTKFDHENARWRFSQFKEHGVPNDAGA